MIKNKGSQRMMNGFAKRLKAARVAHGQTQEEFSRILGIKRDRYAKYELGLAEPPFYILAKIRDLTHLSLDSLIGGRPVTDHEVMRIVGTQISDIQAISTVEASWWWKSDRRHRLVEVWRLHNQIPQDALLARVLGRTRWEAVGADATIEGKWRRHLEDLEARRVFENFRYLAAASDGAAQEICISGKPVFDTLGEFQGYAGYGFNAGRIGEFTEAV